MCFAYAVRQRSPAGTRHRTATPALIDLHTQSGSLSVQINKRRCSVSFLGPSSVLLPHHCDAHQLSVGMMVTRVRRRALHADDGRDRA